MAKKDREKLRKAKARKAKNVQATKAAQAEAKAGDAGAATRDEGQASENRAFGVDSVGRPTGGGGSPLMPRRSKKG